MKKLKIVGVMGSGRKSWSDLTEPFGAALAQLPVHLLTGGGDGVMRSVSRGFTSVEDRKGLSLGCLPMMKQEDGNYSPYGKYPNPYVELAIQTPLGVYNADLPDDITRNHINVLTSDIIVAFPGQAGTRNEIALAQKFNKAVLLYGPAEEFADMDETLPRTSEINEALIWVQAQLDYLPK